MEKSEKRARIHKVHNPDCQLEMEVMSGFSREGERYSAPCIYITHFIQGIQSSSLTIYLDREDAATLRALATQLELAWDRHNTIILQEK